MTFFVAGPTALLVHPLPPPCPTVRSSLPELPHSIMMIPFDLSGTPSATFQNNSFQNERGQLSAREREDGAFRRSAGALGALVHLSLIHI